VGEEIQQVERDASKIDIPSLLLFLCPLALLQVHKAFKKERKE
jgi:hypothetical protein